MLKYQEKILYIVQKLIFSLFLFLTLFLFGTTQVGATGQVLGIHILNVDEIKQFRQVFTDEEWRHVTIPLTLNDLNKKKEWQEFFDSAYEQKIIPIVRLSTRFDPELNAWVIPNKKDITELASFLGQLDWHQDKKYIIVFNEVNHANEWGATLDPASYAEVLKFTSNWFRTENRNYQILPAAMDLATINDRDSLEAFNYLSQLHANDPEIFSYIDYWNSHSYPNPGFESSPQRNTKDSLRGFIYELAFLKQKTGSDYQVFITETGWVANNSTNYYLSNYYLYALQHIWSDPRIIAVTPFVMRGSPGPFEDFSFFDGGNNATIQLFAMQHALRELES